MTTATHQAAVPQAHAQQKTYTSHDFDVQITGRFDGQRGWYCLGYIDGDPSAEIKEPLHQEWYFYPRQRAVIAERCAQLAARKMNLYWATCLFNAKKRSYKNAIESPWLWQDDAPADVRCSELIQTSEYKYQALIRLDRPATADERQQLQEAWRDQVGADACSKDAVHMGRMPGGFNTKRHGCFLVQSIYHADLVISADRRLAKLPKPEPKASGIITDLAWPAVEKHLANMPALLASVRAQLIRPETQSGRILAGEMLPFPVKKGNDDSRSMNAYVLANGFYMRGFLDAEIAAVVMYHYRAWGKERDNGTAWCKNDITSRILPKIHAAKPGIVQSPTRYTANEPSKPLVETPAASRARTDRPRTLDPLMLFNRYKADPTLCEKPRKARATALDISTATLDRLDLALRDMNLIAIEQPGCGLPGRVLVLGGVINIAADGVLSAPDAPIADLGIETAQTDDRNLQCIGGTHQPPETPPVPQPPAATPAAPRSLTEAVRLAFDRVRVKPDTGERQRVTRKRLLRVLAECWPQSASEERLDQVIADERTRRRCADTVADMATMNPPTLRAQIRLMERLGDKSRELGTNLYRFADWAARALRRELASRPAEPGRKSRKNCEALPDPRKVVERQQAELWQVADRGLEFVRAERRGGGGIGAGVFPQTPAPVADAIDGWATIRRLQQAAIQRQ